MNKKLVLLLAFPLLYGCKDKTTSKSIKEISWMDVRENEFQLVRPISFGPDAKDGYYLPLRTNQWYLVSTSAGCALLPVDIYIGGGPTYVEDVIHREIAILDTVAEHLLCASKYAPQVENYTLLEVVCFIPGHSPKPSLDSTGKVTLYTEIVGGHE